jgi:hypothetical protein
MLIEQALLGLGEGISAARVVPFWVPALVGMVALGHLFSGLRGRRCGVLELAPLPRALVYVGVVVLLVVLAPGVATPFIYWQF